MATPKYSLMTGKNYDQSHKFELKPLKFKLMDETLPLLQKINKLTAIDYKRFEGVTQSPGADSDLGLYLEMLEMSKKVLSTKEFRDIFNLQVDIFKKTIQFDKTTSKYEEQIMNDEDFWLEQDITELNQNLLTFRQYIK